jgi:hypothetical protein
MAPAEQRPLIVEARVYLGVYVALAIASVLAGSPIALLVWITPWVTLALVGLFAWNMPYHAEHHAYPAVPFHALPRLHHRVRSRIENLEPGSIAATAKVNRHLFGRGAGILRHPG